MDLERLARVAAQRHGLVTRADAERLGVSRSAWYRALAAGRLVAVQPGVARLHGAPVTREQRIAAAVLAAGPGALASHRSAAFLLGVERPERDPVDITLGRSRRVALDGVEVHRPTVRVDLRRTTRRGIACTNELRTLVDLGAVDASAVPGALEAFLAAGRVPLAAVHELASVRHARRGHPGVVALRRALADYPLDAAADSGLEVAMARLLRRHGLPPAEHHARVAGFEVDFLISGTPIVIECDGWTTHVGDREQWQFDLERDAQMAAEGFVVLRRSPNQILRRGAETARRIRDLVARWAPEALAP